MSTAFTPANVKAAMNAAGAGSRDLWQVPVAELHVVEGFNVRIQDDEYTAHVETIKGLIRANGFRQDKPLAGFVAESGIIVTDGHTRLAAVKALIAEGVEIESLPVVVAPKGTTEEDLIVGLKVANSGSPLRPYETGLICKRLIGFGWDEKKIAEKLGLTVPYVNDLLALVGSAKDVRDLVTSGAVAATAAIEAIKTHKGAAADALKAGVEVAKRAGKKKATSKHIRAATAAMGPRKLTLKEIAKELIAIDAKGSDFNHEQLYKAVKKLADEARRVVR